MIKKRSVAFALAGMLALAPLTACGSAEPPVEEAPQEEGTEEEVPTDDGTDEGTDNTDGWTVNGDYTTTLSNDEEDIFDQAMADYDGDELTPVTVLATQVVSGANYAYLCEETDADADSDAGAGAEGNTNWAIAVVYNDLEGEASVTSVTEVDLDDIKVGSEEDSDEDLVGGWTVSEQQGTASLPDEAEAVFEAAADEYAGVELEPVVLLGTMGQDDEMTYAVLCKGAAVANNPAQTLYVVEMSEDAAGNAEFGSVQVLDLLEYV